MFFEPVRGGTRGGQAEFKWSDVSADKDREVSVHRYQFHGVDSHSSCRITWAIVSTPQQEDGKRTKTSIGITEIIIMGKQNAKKKSAKSKRRKRMHFLLHCAFGRYFMRIS